MFGSWNRRRVIPLVRRGAVLVALCGFVVSVVGVPMLVVAPGSEASRPIASTRPACCCQRAGDSAGQCCGRCGCSKSKPASANAAETPQVEFVLSILAHKCQGQSAIWLALGAVSPPPPPLTIALDAPRCGSVMAFTGSWDHLLDPPATPPPRI